MGGKKGGFTEGGKGKGHGKTASRGGGKKRGYSGVGRDGGGRRQASKEDLFVLANFKLMLEPETGEGGGGDWGVDELVEWKKVHEACRVSNEEYSCPICFEHPAAARVSRCGHYFCLPCLMMCMKRLSESSLFDLTVTLPCPLCQQPTQYLALKPLTNLSVHDSVEYMTEEFVLVYRSPSGVKCRKAGNNGVVTEGERQFNRYYVASLSDVLSVQRRELEELQEKLLRFTASCGKTMDEMRDTSGPASSILAAINFLSEQIVVTQTQIESSKQSTDAAPTTSRRRRLQQQQQSGEGEVVSAAQQAEPSVSTNLPVDAVTFHQVADGRPVFLHPTHSACLLGITNKVTLPIKLQKHTQSPGTRSVYPSLAHIPLHSTFYIAAVNIEKAVEDGVVQEGVLTEAQPYVEPLKPAERTFVDFPAHPATPDRSVASVCEQVMRTLKVSLGVEESAIRQALHPETLEQYAVLFGSAEEILVDAVLEKLSITPHPDPQPSYPPLSRR